jgi:hypothetical protein
MRVDDRVRLAIPAGALAALASLAVLYQVALGLFTGAGVLIAGAIAFFIGTGVAIILSSTWLKNAVSIAIVAAVALGRPYLRQRLFQCPLAGPIHRSPDSVASFKGGYWASGGFRQRLPECSQLGHQIEARTLPSVSIQLLP